MMKKVLISFVGSNDAGKLSGGNDGAILSAVKNEKFTDVILLWNDGKNKEITYQEIVSYLKKEISKRRISVKDQKLSILDVTDHNEIYVHLKEFTDTLPKNAKIQYTAAISSGTPSMQACWILLAESGDFSETDHLKLIKVKDPKFGKSANIPVILSSSLPKIIRLKNEVEEYKNKFLPVALIDVEKGKLFIADQDVYLTPIEFCYYRYFAKVLLEENKPRKFSFIYLPLSVMEEIYSFHEESFPNLDLNRLELKKMIKEKREIPMSTFRGVISKINRKLTKLNFDEIIIENFQIKGTGQKGAKFYMIQAPSNKIKITS